MKILMLHNNYKEISGEDIAVKNEFDLLSEDHNVELIEFQNHFKLGSLISFKSNNKSSYNKIYKNVELFKPDLIYAHNTWFTLAVEPLKKLINQNNKVLLKVHNFRFDCINGIHFRDNQICHDCNEKTLSEGVKNACYQNSIIKSTFAVNYTRNYQKLLKDNLKILTLTKFHKNYLENTINTKNKVEILFNPVKIKNLSNEVKLTKQNYCIYAGRVSDEKGVLELINTWNDFNKLSNPNNTILKIVGEGRSINNFKSLKVNNIEFHEKVKNEDLLKLIENAKFFISNTKLYEGQPNIIAESVMQYTPIIIPTNGGIKEFFPNNSKLIFNQNIRKDLLSKLKLTNDDKLLKRESINNYEFFNKNYSSNIYKEKFLRIANKYITR